MSGTSFNTGQLGRLQSVISAAVATALPKIGEQFADPKAVLEAVKNKVEVLAGHLEELVAEAIKRMMVLVHRERASLTTSAQYDSSSLQTEKGLWVYGEYTKLVASKAKHVEAGTTFDFDIFEIGKPEGATDAENEASLPKAHLFKETAVNAIIAAARAKQPNGEKGRFPTNRAILLYTESCVVSFYWDSDVALWHVNTWGRGGCRWRQGDWVLSPAN